MDQTYDAEILLVLVMGYSSAKEATVPDQLKLARGRHIRYECVKGVGKMEELEG